MEPLFSLLFLLLLLCPSWLYSLHNCTIDFTNPQSIDCGNLQLSRIPSDIPRSAVYLVVYMNDIQRIYQGDFHGLENLQRLDLGSNEISFIEDYAFSPLSALTELYLNQNKLTNLTDNMFIGLSNVTLLELSMNEIACISESTFIPLRRLQELYLEDNILCRLNDLVNIVSFCQLLKILRLSHNRLTSFESEQFPFPVSITDLDLSRMPLSRFALYYDVFPHLQSLRLSDIENELQWDVANKTFLKNLRTLDLSGTYFSIETYKLIFQSTDSLEKLVLRDIAHLDNDLVHYACGIQSLQKLDLMMNGISGTIESLLLPCSNLTELDLSENPMLYLTPSSLRRFTCLSHLFVASNRMIKVPQAIRNMTSLTFLSVGSNHIRILGCLDFSNLTLLTVLDLSDNRLTELRGCVLQDLQSLQILYIEQNFIFNFDDSFRASLSNLQTISAYGNNILRLQKGTFQNMSDVTDINFERVTGGTFVEEGAFDGLTNLSDLAFSPTLINHTSVGVGPQTNSWGQSQLRQVFNLSSLQNLNLSVSEDYCFRWPQGFLQGLDDLKVLVCKRCFCVTPDSETFIYTPHLLHLEVWENELWIPHPKLFQPLTALQTLELYKNELTSLDFLIEANLMQLEALVVRNNHLSVINVTVFEALPSLRYLDLYNNPFACNCSNADFILWAIMNKKVYIARLFQYKCSYPLPYEGQLLLEFNVRWCLESTGFLSFIFSSALVLLTLLSTFLHHFLRFHLLYGFYLLQAFLYHRQKRRQAYAELYDSFVSYNIHDEEWVYRELVPELEGRQGWRLCLHHRDFEPGKAILENITDAIYSSRKTLCVISQHYLLSEWCSREIQMASFRLLDEQKDVLILLFLEELSSSQLSPFFRMRKLLRSRTYLTWSGARAHRGLFWERVRRALQSGAQLPADNPLPTNA